MHPDEVIKYIRPEECQLSYNPLLMALLWNTLATRETQLLEQALRKRFNLPEGTAWVNYIRCHDDIGWTFSDEDAAEFGIRGYDHRRFLNSFFTGRFEGSFARGLPFQENPNTGDCRISGTCASLAGLEKAIKEEGAFELSFAIRRILLIHGLAMFAGGVPLLYLGDEIGMLNDYTYQEREAEKNDSRWVHRPFADAKAYARRHEPQSTEGRVFSGLRELIHLRKSHAAFGQTNLEVLPLGNRHLVAFVKQDAKEKLCVVANFSESEQTIPENLKAIALRPGSILLQTAPSSDVLHRLGGISLTVFKLAA